MRGLHTSEKKMKEKNKTKAVEKKNLYPLTTCHLIAEKKNQQKTNE